MGFSLDEPIAKPLLTRYVGGEGQRRYFQDAAIRAVLEEVAQSAAQGRQPRALLSLATGTGKTFIACHLLKRIADAGQLKRALFLCDRDELRVQGLKAMQGVFGADAAEVYDDGGRNHAKNARVHVATYQTRHLTQALVAVDAARRAAGERLAGTESLSAAYLREVFDGPDASEWKVVMRRGNVASALQYVPELTWILFLRILDETEEREEQEADAVGASYTSSLKKPYRWKDWAAPLESTKAKLNKRKELEESSTNAFKNFVNSELIPYLKKLKEKPNATARQKVISEIMSGVEKTRIDTGKTCSTCSTRSTRSRTRASTLSTSSRSARSTRACC
jgi:hypothetical protein